MKAKHKFMHWLKHRFTMAVKTNQYTAPIALFVLAYMAFAFVFGVVGSWLMDKILGL